MGPGTLGELAGHGQETRGSSLANVPQLSEPVNSSELCKFSNVNRDLYGRVRIAVEAGLPGKPWQGRSAVSLYPSQRRARR